MLPTDGYCFDNAPEVGHFSAELNSEWNQIVTTPKKSKFSR
jgi:hypothetical protein